MFQSFARVSFYALVSLLPALAAVGQEKPVVIYDMDRVAHQPAPFGDEKKPAGTVELVDGKVGKACKFTFVDKAQGGFFVSNPHSSPEWDKAAGFRFWVKGDGSRSWGGIELIDKSDYGARYAYCFPIDSTEWRKITVPWQDLIPEMPAAKFIGGKDGYQPSGFGNFNFGKWWYWHDYPAESFAIDEVVLEPAIKVDATDYMPASAGAANRVLAKLKAKKPITVVTMGDSLSDKRHWSNHDVLWSELLVNDLKAKFGSDAKLVNPSLGGTQLTQNLILMPRWLIDAPEPDVVSIWFGGNDWDSGMRGPHFAEALRFAVDRVRRMTHGKSDVLLMTTCPGEKTWDATAELAEAVRTVAAEKRTMLADVAKAFHARGDADANARHALFASDGTHLGAEGKAVAERTVMEALSGAK